MASVVSQIVKKYPAVKKRYFILNTENKSESFRSINLLITNINTIVNDTLLATWVINQCMISQFLHRNTKRTCPSKTHHAKVVYKHAGAVGGTSQCCCR